MDTGSKRQKKDGNKWKMIHKEQVRKVLKFFETRGTPASDDISSSPSACKMAITTSDGIVADAKRAEQPNEALERAFSEYMTPAPTFAAMLKKNMGMMSSNQLFRNSAPHFSPNFLEPDIGTPGSTMTVVCHVQSLSWNSVEFVTAQAGSIFLRR